MITTADNIIRRDIIQLEFKSDLTALKKLNGEVDDVKKKFKDGIGDDALKELKQNAKETVKPLENVKNAAKEIVEKVTEIGKKAATTAVNGLKKVVGVSFNTLKTAISKTATKLTELGKKAAVTAFNGLKKVAGISFKALAVGIGAAATAVGALVTKSVQAYADYEQFVGGVDTLFKGSSGTVQKYANDAYKTAGMSANDYLNNVTSFSASLISSLGGDTAKAAEVANRAIIDMSDNSAKMGTDMDSIIQTYQSLARGNFQMLDNLKLGYGGTKEELKRLIKEASAMTDVQAELGVTVDSSSMSFANIINAISVVQKNMDISGTTAKESAHTISGSLASMKAAWNNMLPALIKGGDAFDQCIDNLIESIVGVEDKFGNTTGGVINNLRPAITKALSGVGKLIEKLAPIIEKEFPVLVDQLLPPLIKATTALISGIIKALPDIARALAKEVPDIAKQLLGTIGETFGKQLPAVQKFVDYLKENTNKVKKFFTDNADAIGTFGGVLLGLVGAFMALSKIKSVVSIFSGLFSKSSGGGSGGIFGIFTNLANMKTTTVLKGMANLAIILGGVGILTTAIVAVAPYIAKMSDFKSVIKLAGMMGVVSILGLALAKFGGIAGAIPVSIVAKGLANMAIMLAGIGVLTVALAWVANKTKELINVKDILKLSAMMLVVGGLGTVLGVFAGIVGAIPIPVVLTGLANIALVLGGVTALIVAFAALSKIKGFNDFIKSGGETLATIFNIIGKVGGSLIGGLGEGISNSLPAIGENLAKFGDNIKPLFNAMKGVDMGGVAAFFTSIVGLLAVATGKEIIDGIKSFFGVGESSLSKLGEELADFATKAKPFFVMVATLPENGFVNATKMFDCLAGVKSLPKEGGVVGWFGGKVNYANVATGLGQLSGEGVKNFFAMVGGLKEKSFENTKLFFESLSSISELPSEGGWWQKLKGDKTTTLGKIAGEIESFSTKAETFFEQVNNLKLANLNGLWESLNKSEEVTANVSTVIDDKISEIVKKISDLPKKMGDGLRRGGRSLSEALVEVWTDAVRASVKPVNKVLEAANWILKEFGSDKRVISWEPYAKGTGGHKGGNALVNDGRGAEMVQMPNGRTFIPSGRNVFLPNAPKGMKVLPAEQTARLMGKKKPTYHYANGIGDIDLWSYIDNASGLASKISDSVSYSGMSGYALHLGKGMVSTFTGEMTGWIEKLFDEAGAKSIADYVASAGVEQWRSTVIRALKMEGEYNAANVKRTLYQMQTESGGNPKAINLWDDNAKNGIPSKGLMQVIDPTFRTYARNGFDKNIYDPLSNILASVRYAKSRYGSLAKAYRGVGYSKGVGEVTLPSQSSDVKVSYTPESDYSTYSRTVVENNSYAPTFNLTIEGTSDDRAMARKVKKWIAEALEETFESMERKTTRLQEV